MCRLGKHFLVVFVSGWFLLVGDLPITTASSAENSTSSLKQNLVAQKKGKKGGKKGKRSMGGKGGGGGARPGHRVPRKFANTTWGWNNGIVP
jgi:hypothetical protein